jgi:DNA-binding transcriptional LysR family regulator
MTAGAEKISRDTWLAIEIRHLAALATVAKHASFSGAAESLGYVQSAVSQQVACLERIAGRRLVQRPGKARPLALTDAGDVLVEHIETIFEQLRLAKTEIDAVTHSAAAPATVGLASVVGDWATTGLVEAMMQHDVDSWLKLRRGSSQDLLDAVRVGSLDAAFVELPISAGPFFAIELLRKHCVLVAPEQLRARHTSIASLLSRWPLVAIHDCTITQRLREQYGARLAHSVETPEAALSFVQAGAAAAVVLPRGLRSAAHSFTTLPLADLPPRTLGLAWHRERDRCASVGVLRAAMCHVLR